MEVIIFVAGLVAGVLAAALFFAYRRQGLIQDKLALENTGRYLEKERAEAADKLHGQQEEILRLNRQMVHLDTSNRNLLEKLELQRKEMEENQAYYRLQFENLANRIFEESTERFTRQNISGISQVLDPLKEKLRDFEEKVRLNSKESTEQHASLREQIGMLRDLGMMMSNEAKNLTQALKGDNKTQGNWGELVLERILESSGLQEGREYTLQGRGMGMTDEHGARQMPDVIIRLPQDKHIIIDAKVSLVAYEEWMTAESDHQVQHSLKRHIDSVRRHIAGLGERYYHASEQLHSPDFVLLFLPIEASLSITMQADGEIFEFAWRRKVVLVTPSTLLATLKTIGSVWKYEKQNANAMEIARMGGLLYDQFVDFVTEMDKIKKGIDTSSMAYDEAMKRLVFNSGSLLRRAEKLRALGVKNKKLLKKEYLEQPEDIIDIQFGDRASEEAAESLEEV